MPTGLNCGVLHAVEFGITLDLATLSSWATLSVEVVASIGPGNCFIQLHFVRKAERAGFKAITLTIDTPRLGRQKADIKDMFMPLPPFLTVKNFEGLDIGKMDEALALTNQKLLNLDMMSS
ncbi:hypothetical protein M8C21_003909 [Ambrosia artemisiifolia]|uniref:FMN-dependent dehydrogenase domain-containing protein n=1 Tax=Ambrosia artemisiifolia TaxID=4212 RepID=A0AAD5CRP8_AMBAR|nr:hypothetical protein M8C21_003909 [Ambrosia artemisiifolia]